MFHGPIRDRLVLTRILLAPGGEKLSSEAAQILAVITMEKRPYYVGDKNEPREFPRKSVDGIVKSLGQCHRVNQGLIRDRDNQDRSIAWMKVIVAVFGALNLFLGTVLALLKFLK